MDTTDIKVLLELGERISFECKKLKITFQNHYWRLISLEVLLF